MELFRNINYMLEILLAELVFLHAFPRRSCFPLRLVLALAACLGVGYLEGTQRSGSGLLTFIWMLGLLALTVTGMFSCFQGSFLSILSACVAGVALQHIGHHASRLIALLSNSGTWNALWEFFACLVLDAAALALLAGPLRRTRYYESYTPLITGVSLVIVLLCVGATRFLRLGGSLNLYGAIYTSLYPIICCLLALFLQFFLHYFVQFKSEYLLLRRIRAEERAQYEMSREKAELINIKCHDLKHKLLALGGRLPQAELDSMREIIDSYDGIYHTGLDALDIVLNEKSLRCRSRNIALTYLGPGAELSFLDPMDLYSMLGNVLDNAIDAAERFQEPEKRAISVVIERKGDLVFLSTLNYLDRDLSFAEGLPQTTKEGEAGYHGYGLKSVREIARRYQGDLSVSAGEGVFHLTVYFMQG